MSPYIKPWLGCVQVMQPRTLDQLRRKRSREYVQHHYIAELHIILFLCIPPHSCFLYIKERSSISLFIIGGLGFRVSWHPLNPYSTAQRNAEAILSQIPFNFTQDSPHMSSNTAFGHPQIARQSGFAIARPNLCTPSEWSDGSICMRVMLSCPSNPGAYPFTRCLRSR